MNVMNKPAAVPAPGTNPDAELIALCATFASVTKERYDAINIYAARGEDAPDEVIDPLHAQAEDALDQILDTKAATMAGVMARAKALFVYDSEIIVPGGMESSGWRDDQARALIRDLLAIDAAPAEPHSDAELIMLCRSFIALEEAYRAEPCDDDDTPLQKEVMAKQSAMISQLYETRAQTVEGSVMRLRAAVAYCPELMRSGGGSLSEILLTAAIRDLTGEEVR